MVASQDQAQAFFKTMVDFYCSTPSFQDHDFEYFHDLEKSLPTS